MIFSAFERMVAMRYLRARRQEGFISVIAGFSLLGIALGVATLIIVMSVMNGFRAELLGRVLGLNGHLNVYSVRGGPLPDYDPLVQRLQGVPGVVGVTPTVEGQALVSVRGVASGAVVRGVRPEDFRVRPTLSRNIVRGTAEAFGDDNIAIGIRMAQRLGLAVGDQMTLIAPQGNVTAFGTVPRMRSFTIGAVFDVGMFEYDNSFIFLPLPEAQAFFRTGEAVTSLEVFVSDPTRIREARDAIQSAVAGVGRVVDWQQSNASFFTALQVERNVMFLILSLIITVAAFNIISSLIMLVKDKGRDIAILRTMGATRGMIMRIFFLSGASVGVAGTLLGVALGVSFALNIETIRQGIQALTGTNLFNAEIYFLSQLPAKIDWSEVVQVTLMALGLSFAATVYPSWRAARLDPVEALRYE
ncbi:lipoprotein-releasing system transmembrane subunit LolC [Azospirillum baldaniorum]|uniref:Lipoprotein ABC transporter permease component LolC n=1 Tax=Azospirillum baldaniorum TaxID=1064539 RepID=A0A9P1JQL0_9PROT|nr:lipoprotein-releasing ABC transporter permease subunit [Azospirillum baldaniorum]AWJ90074.1 lipoprotein-releasing system transmembrane subunit LolC [Azospirillum baldaniorum]NUB05548.1 lipoprotein-releasing ABC transporter permease subunit [Azospirillum baldaniorum]TWA77385.1 lipoprotein-releasing system permease protein [Azospirillum brasilense]CCC97880.1 lipoprotein ABC transporter; permease component LolC [Azospirillum baldaniorum]